MAGLSKSANWGRWCRASKARRCSLIVAAAAFTGARRSLRYWRCNGPISIAANKTLRIERAIEETVEAWLADQGTEDASAANEPSPSTMILLALLMAERDKHRRIVAGVP